MKQYFTYVLFSTNFRRTYVGQTEDVEERLEKHNKGLVKSTKKVRQEENL